MNYSEKYYRINLDFPDKAGKLKSVIETQKRLVEAIARMHPKDEDIKALLVSVAEGYGVTDDLLTYMKNVLQGVANDSAALLEGSKIRTQHRDQGEEIIRLWNGR